MVEPLRRMIEPLRRINESVYGINELISYVYDGINELVRKASLDRVMPRALAHEAPPKTVVIPKESNSAFVFIINLMNSYQMNTLTPL